MTTEVAQEVRLVEVIENEDGDYGWAKGHVEPALMVLSAIACKMIYVGADEALAALIGHEVRHTNDVRRWTMDDAMSKANRMLDSVSHLWTIEDGENEELVHIVGEGTPGAEPWTRVWMDG